MIYRILFLGDIVGKPGRTAIRQGLPSLKETYKPLFTIVNGENSAAGHGITPDIADELLAQGVDAITLGNHAFNRKEAYNYIQQSTKIARPYNMVAKTPGRGLVQISKDGVDLAVANLCGRVYLEGYDNPFTAFDEIYQNATGHLFVDFHGEVTSEKIAMGWHAAGRATALVGTHTHVQTADERILEDYTAYITDVGMSGPENGVIGTDKEPVLYRFRTGLPARFEVADGPGVICGVMIEVERDSGRAVHIERVRLAT